MRGLHLWVVVGVMCLVGVLPFAGQAQGDATRDVEGSPQYPIHEPSDAPADQWDPGTGAEPATAALRVLRPPGTAPEPESEEREGSHEGEESEQREGSHEGEESENHGAHDATAPPAGSAMDHAIRLVGTLESRVEPALPGKAIAMLPVLSATQALHALQSPHASAGSSSARADEPHAHQESSSEANGDAVGPQSATDAVQQLLGMLPVPLLPESNALPTLFVPSPVTHPDEATPSVQSSPAMGPMAGAAQPPNLAPVWLAPVGATALAASVVLGTKLAPGLYRVGDLVRRSVWLPLYARLAKHQLLDHRARQAIIDFLHAHPGATVAMLCAHLSVSTNTINHHLRVLEQSQLVHRARAGRRRCYYAGDDRRSPADRQVDAILSVTAARRVFRAIEGSPGITQAALAKRMRVSATAIAFQVRRLQGVGVVRLERQGRAVAHYPADRVVG